MADTTTENKTTIDLVEKEKLKNTSDKQLDLKNQLINEKDAERRQKKYIDKKITAEEKHEQSGKYWRRVEEWLERNRDVQAQAYVELGTAYIELMGGYVLLVNALAYDENAGLTWLWRQTLGDDGTYKLPDGRPRPTLVGGIIEGVAEGIGSIPGELYNQALRAVGLRKDEVHEIRYSIDIDDEHRLTTTVTKDGEPLSEDQKILFDTGFVAWIEKEKGYAFDEKNQILLKDDKPLNNDKLKELNVDDEHGLAAFFDSKMGLEVKETYKPRF